MFLKSDEDDDYFAIVATLCSQLEDEYKNKPIEEQHDPAAIGMHMITDAYLQMYEKLLRYEGKIPSSKKEELN